jgi:hypothetical protein
VTSVYGAKYGGLLVPLLYSIKRSNPRANVTVFWQDVTPAIRLLERVYPEYEFIDVGVGRHADLIDNIGEKAPLWAKAAAHHPGEQIVLMDSDMLVLKDVSHYFEEEFEAGFTHKVQEPFPLNTGVFLLRTTPGLLAFLDVWARRTTEIITTPALREQATGPSHPYGGPDQMAWWELIGFDRTKNDYVVQSGDEALRIKGFPCSELNETRSCPVTNDTHIIHYKGGWHPILMDGTGFTVNRPRNDSWQMYLLYLQTYREASRYAAEKLPANEVPKSFGIAVPFYFDANLEPSPFLYKLFAMKESVAIPLRTWMKAAKRRLKARAKRAA